ncbi:MAG: hypothetical protein ACOZBL_05530 [Patescibacteria group bacterium]
MSTGLETTLFSTSLIKSLFTTSLELQRQQLRKTIKGFRVYFSTSATLALQNGCEVQLELST